MTYYLGLCATAGALAAATLDDGLISSPTSISPATGALFTLSFAFSFTIIDKFVSKAADRIFDNSAEGRVLKAAIRFFAGLSASLAILSLTGITMPLEAAALLILKALAIVLVFEIFVKGLCFEN
jgi:hypothetical protein